MLDRLRRRAWGLSGRLIASYILVTLAVVVLVEVLVLGFQVPLLVNGAQLQEQVNATAKSYAERYPGGVPAGTVLGQRGQPPPSRTAFSPPSSSQPRTARWPFPRSPARSRAARRSPQWWRSPPTARSSRPPRPPCTRPERRRPANSPCQWHRQLTVGQLIKRGTLSTLARHCPLGPGLDAGRVGPGRAADSKRGTVIYVQTPWSTGFINPITAWSELVQLGEARALLSGPSALLLAIVPVGVLFGLLASHGLVRRVRRLEQATLAVADGDYTVDAAVLRPG